MTLTIPMNPTTAHPSLLIPVQARPAALPAQQTLVNRDGERRQRAYLGRRTFTPEDRARALRLIEQGKSQAQTARELGIKEVTVGAWFRAAQRAARAQLPEVSGIRAELLALRVSLQGRLAALARERVALQDRLAGLAREHAALNKTQASVREALDL